jgi:hypothetical protein
LAGELGEIALVVDRTEAGRLGATNVGLEIVDVETGFWRNANPRGGDLIDAAVWLGNADASRVDDDVPHVVDAVRREELRLKARRGVGQHADAISPAQAGGEANDITVNVVPGAGPLPAYFGNGSTREFVQLSTDSFEPATDSLISTLTGRFERTTTSCEATSNPPAVTRSVY